MFLGTSRKLGLQLQLLLLHSPTAATGCVYSISSIHNLCFGGKEQTSFLQAQNAQSLAELAQQAPLVTDFNKNWDVYGKEGDSLPWELYPRSGEEPRGGNTDLGVTPPYEFCSLVKDALVRQDLANSDRIKYTWFHFSDRLLCCQAHVSNMT